MLSIKDFGNCKFTVESDWSVLLFQLSHHFTKPFMTFLLALIYRSIVWFFCLRFINKVESISCWHNYTHSASHNLFTMRFLLRQTFLFYFHLIAFKIWTLITLFIFRIFTHRFSCILNTFNFLTQTSVLVRVNISVIVIKLSQILLVGGFNVKD